MRVEWSTPRRPHSTAAPALHTLTAAYAEITKGEYALRKRFYQVVHGKAVLEADVILAKLMDFIIFITVVVSTITYIVETVPQYYDPDPATSMNAFFWLEALCVFVLTGDMALRVASALKVDDLVNIQTVVDFLSIAGFYFSLYTGSIGLTSLEDSAEVLRVLRLLRLFRVVRLFLRTRLGEGFLTVAETLLIETRSGLLMLGLLVIVAWITLTSFFYAAEASANTWDPDQQLWIQADGSVSPFQTIPQCIWIVSLTMATVGYGDVYPGSKQGRAVAVLIMCVGVLFLAMPTMIVGSTFERLHRGANHHAAQRRLGKLFRKVRCIVRFTRMWRDNRRLGYMPLLVDLGVERRLSPVAHTAPPTRNRFLSEEVMAHFDFEPRETDPLCRRDEKGEAPSDLTEVLSSASRNRHDAYHLLLRLMECFSGCATTRELVSSVAVTPHHSASDPEMVVLPRLRDVAYLTYRLARAGLVHAFALDGLDDLLVALPRSTAQRLRRDAAFDLQCLRCIAEARRIWHATTGDTLDSFIDLDEFTVWRERQAKVPARTASTIEHDHKHRGWRANDITWGMATGDARHCDACLHCAPHMSSFRDSDSTEREAAVALYRDLLQGQRTLLQLRRRELAKRRAELEHDAEERRREEAKPCS